MRVYWVALLALLALACGRRQEDGSRLRVGYMARLTHAPALTGIGSGRFDAALPGVALETHAFEVGNAIVEAMFAGELDVAYLGPNPAINGFVRSGGQDVRVVAGVATGGARFVVRNDARVHAPGDLTGKRIATPQIASTQDIALRTYLEKHGLASTLSGGDVVVLPLASALIPSLLEQRELDGAWVSEPLASALVVGQGARVFVDEKDEWENGVYLTTVLAVRPAYLEKHPEVVARFVGAHVDETRFVEEQRPMALALARETMQRVSGRALPDAVAQSAFGTIEFSSAPRPDVLEKCAEHARRAGFLPAADLSKLIAPEPLEAALARRIATAPP